MPDAREPRESLSNPVIIGVIAAPHGVRGTVRVKPAGDGRHIREGLEPVLRGARCRLLNVRETPKGFLVDIAGFTDRDDVEVLRGAELFLDRSELDPPDEDEVYVGDLVGLFVFDTEGGEMGRVTDTFDNGAHEVLVVRGKYGGEVYVPFTYEHVPEIDIASGRIVASPPEE